MENNNLTPLIPLSTSVERGKQGERFQTNRFAPRWCSMAGKLHQWRMPVVVKKTNNKQGCTYYLNLFSDLFSHPTAMLVDCNISLG